MIILAHIVLMLQCFWKNIDLFLTFALLPFAFSLVLSRSSWRQMLLIRVPCATIFDSFHSRCSRLWGRHQMKRHLIGPQGPHNHCTHSQNVVRQPSEAHIFLDRKHEDLSICRHHLLYGDLCEVLRRVHSQMWRQFLKITLMNLPTDNVDTRHGHTSASHRLQYQQLWWCDWLIRNWRLVHFSGETYSSCSASHCWENRSIRWCDGTRCCSIATPPRRDLRSLSCASRSTAGKGREAPAWGLLTCSRNCASSIVWLSNTRRFSVDIPAIDANAPRQFLANVSNSPSTRATPGWPTPNANVPRVSKPLAVRALIALSSRQRFRKWALESTIEIIAKSNLRD